MGQNFIVKHKRKSLLFHASLFFFFLKHSEVTITIKSRVGLFGWIWALSRAEAAKPDLRHLHAGPRTRLLHATSGRQREDIEQEGEGEPRTRQTGGGGACTRLAGRGPKVRAAVCRKKLSARHAFLEVGTGKG